MEISNPTIWQIIFRENHRRKGFCVRERDLLNFSKRIRSFIGIFEKKKYYEQQPAKT